MTDAKNLTKSEKMNRLREFLFDMPSYETGFEEIRKNLMNFDSHLTIHQSEQTDAEVLERILNESNHVSVNGRFSSDSMQWNSITDTLEKRMSYIYDRLETLSFGQGFPIQIDDMDYSSSEEAPVIGTGFIRDMNGFLHSFENSSCVSLYVQKDDNMPFGFSVKTAYAGLMIDRTDEAERYRSIVTESMNKLNVKNDDCSETVKQTKTFQDASPAKKAEMLYRADSSRYDTHVLLFANDDNTIKYKFKIPGSENEEYRAFLEPGSYKLYRYKDGKKADWPLAQEIHNNNYLDLRDNKLVAKLKENGYRKFLNCKPFQDALFLKRSMNYYQRSLEMERQQERQQMAEGIMEQTEIIEPNLENGQYPGA